MVRCFAMTRGAFRIHLQDGFLTQLLDVSRGIDDNSIDTPDPADLVDADALEDILSGTPTAPTCDSLTVDETPADQTEAGDHPDTMDSESARDVVIEKFAFGRPGAPIPCDAQGPAAHDTQEATPTGSAWAPFCSQLDWELARWAKRCGLTSTAVSELLAIPGVRVYTFQYHISNSIAIGRRHTWTVISDCQ